MYHPTELPGGVVMWGLVWFLTGCVIGVMFTFIVSFLAVASDK